MASFLDMRYLQLGRLVQRRATGGNFAFRLSIFVTYRSAGWKMIVYRRAAGGNFAFGLHVFATYEDSPGNVP